MTALRDALRTGDAKALVASVTWPMFELRLTKVLGPAMLKAYQQAGLDVYGQMGAVVKENPYHDELGRFTSGPGGSWVSEAGYLQDQSPASVVTGVVAETMPRLKMAADRMGFRPPMVGYVSSGQLGEGNIAAYINGSAPDETRIVIDAAAHAQDPGAVQETLVHELAHAAQDWLGQPYDEARAEEFAQDAQTYGISLAVDMLMADLDPTYTAPLRKAAPAASLALRFDTQTPGTKKWIERRTAALVKSITEQQREAIRTVIGRVYRAGMGVDDAIPLVRAALGENALFPRWAQAVVNYGMGLQEQGITPARVAEMTDAYYERLADQRAYMIARTEVLAAQNAGRMEGWTQLAEEGIIRVDEVLKEWDASHEGVCEECDALDGTQVGLFDEFPDGPPPLHPSCRCVQNLVRA